MKFQRLIDELTIHAGLNGHYIVDGEIFFSKVYAMLKATELNTDVEFHYYDDIFDQAKSRRHLAYTDLAELYTQRAKQLRECYDYLVLNYSGGSDSHNVLYTFLKNNIKLDCVFIQWPVSLVDKGVYNPNSADTTNYNFHSEWDLVIKKDLEYLALYHPEIKIEIDDWTERVNDNFYGDHLFEKPVSHLPSIARSIKQNSFSKMEDTLLEAGKTVGNIFGVDKTFIVNQNNEWHFVFIDTGFMAMANPKNVNGLEYFYHTPLFPDIAVAQAYKMKGWFEQRTDKDYLVKLYDEKVKNISGYANKSYKEVLDEYKEYCEIFKFICYPYWDFTRFQADKPFYDLHTELPLGVRPWDNILAAALPNFARTQQVWTHYWKSYLSKIDYRFRRSRDRDKPIRTKLFKID